MIIRYVYVTSTGGNNLTSIFFRSPRHSTPSNICSFLKINSFSNFWKCNLNTNPLVCLYDCPAVSHDFLNWAEYYREKREREMHVLMYFMPPFSRSCCAMTQRKNISQERHKKWTTLHFVASSLITTREVCITRRGGSFNVMVIMIVGFWSAGISFMLYQGDYKYILCIYSVFFFHWVKSIC